jgi:hypothetical protein
MYYWNEVSTLLRFDGAVLGKIRKLTSMILLASAGVKCSMGRTGQEEAACWRRRRGSGGRIGGEPEDEGRRRREEDEDGWSHVPLLR